MKKNSEAPYHILQVQTHHPSEWNISWYDTAL